MIEAKINDWAVIRTNKGEVEGTISKINTHTFWIKQRIAGKNNYIKRRNRDLVYVVDF